MRRASSCGALTKLGVVALAAMAGPLPAYGGGVEAAGDLESVTIAVGAPVAPLLVPFFTEQEGLFEKEGIDATVTIVPDANVRQAIAGGAVHVGLAASPQFELIAQKAPVKLVGALAEHWAFQYVGAAGIDSPADLAGKAVAVASPGSVTTILTANMLEQAGVNEDVDRVSGISPGVIVSAFSRGRVSGTVSLEPTVSALLGAVEGASVIHDFSDLDWPLVIAMNTDWAGSHRDAAIAVLRALDAGVKAWLAEPEAAKAMIAERTGAADSTAVDRAYQQTVDTFAGSVIPIRTEVEANVLRILNANGFPDFDPNNPAELFDMSYVEELT